MMPECDISFSKSLAPTMWFVFQEKKRKKNRETASGGKKGKNKKGRENREKFALKFTWLKNPRFLPILSHKSVLPGSSNFPQIPQVTKDLAWSPFFSSHPLIQVICTAVSLQSGVEVRFLPLSISTPRLSAPSPHRDPEAAFSMSSLQSQSHIFFSVTQHTTFLCPDFSDCVPCALVPVKAHTQKPRALHVWSQPAPWSNLPLPIWNPGSQPHHLSLCASNVSRLFLIQGLWLDSPVFAW